MVRPLRVKHPKLAVTISQKNFLFGSIEGLVLFAILIGMLFSHRIIDCRKLRNRKSLRYAQIDDGWRRSECHEAPGIGGHEQCAGREPIEEDPVRMMSYYVALYAEETTSGSYLLALQPHAVRKFAELVNPHCTRIRSQEPIWIMSKLFQLLI